MDFYSLDGIQLSSVASGIKASGQDMVLLALSEEATTAAVFTQNAFCAAPVILARRHLQQQQPRYLLINSGNANAGTGEQGLQNALTSCEILAEEANCLPAEILPFSTGVIGEDLPMACFEQHIPALLSNLSAEGWTNASEGILTTDTCPKGFSRRFDVAGHEVTVSGITKGSGMIRPNMATMLAFIALDAPVEASLLQECLQSAVSGSFNRITVDGDTSTNDACVLMATGKRRMPQITRADTAACTALQTAVNEACLSLAHAIVADGEGASRFICVEVVGGSKKQDCTQVAYTVAHSPLVKTAFFAADPNWGRLLAAVGNAGVENLDINQVQLWIGDICIARNGRRVDDYQESRVAQKMDSDRVTVRIDLGQGVEEDTVWTCDLSYEYIKINAEYRS
jgi:glutamate N-acetyltransferase / amino-acid N-acetyltransferase